MTKLKTKVEFAYFVLFYSNVCLNGPSFPPYLLLLGPPDNAAYRERSWQHYCKLISIIYSSKSFKPFLFYDPLETMNAVILYNF
jgi:hypothetical protein